MLQSKNALVIDSVNVYAEALQQYLTGLDSFSTKSVNCNSKMSGSSWPSGESIYNQIVSVSHQLAPLHIGI